MSESLDYGTVGAKVQTWEGNSARALYARLAKENPQADDEALFHLFFAESAQFIHEIVRSWCANTHRALFPSKRERKALAEADIDALKDRAKKLVLLDWKLPNGKLLRDCTFGECAQAGGWLTELSKKGQPGEKVGAVLSEKEVRAVWKS
jgi:hypothetical protein